MLSRFELSIQYPKSDRQTDGQNFYINIGRQCRLCTCTSTSTVRLRYDCEDLQHRRRSLLCGNKKTSISWNRGLSVLLLHYLQEVCVPVENVRGCRRSWFASTGCIPLKIKEHRHEPDGEDFLFSVHSPTVPYRTIHHPTAKTVSAAFSRQSFLPFPQPIKLVV